MNIVLGLRILLAVALLNIFISLPKLLGMMGINSLEWMLVESITMAVIIFAGLIAAGPLLANPARAGIIIGLLIVVALLVTYSMYNGGIF